MSAESSRLRAARLPLLFYNVCYPFVLLVMLPGFLLRMARRGSYRHKFGQRFGLYSRRVRARVEARDWTWVHAVSVGECLIALKLIDEMKRLDPALNVVLATTTSTGFALARKTATDRPWMEVIYNPLDFGGPVRRALGLFQPRRLVLIEAEVWPNMVSQAVQRGLPVYLVNARMSPRSGARYEKARWLTGPIFRLLTRIFLTEEEERERWLRLGARADQIELTGSIKFDQPLAAAGRAGELRQFLDTLGFPGNGPILLGGSTFEGEEKLLSEVFQKLQPDFPDLRLILVPRHFERTPSVVENLKTLGVSHTLRSKPEPGADCLIVNTTGELRDWYRVATVVFIGKSLTSRGGQNPVEAVMAGAPVICGPNMQNFQAIMSQWRRAQAVVEVPDAPSLLEAVRRLLQDPQERTRLVERAQAAVQTHQGATARSAALIFGEKNP